MSTPKITPVYSVPVIVRIKILTDLCRTDNFTDIEEYTDSSKDNSPHLNKGVDYWALDAGEYWLVQRDAGSGFTYVVYKGIRALAPPIIDRRWAEIVE